MYAPGKDYSKFCSPSCSALSSGEDLHYAMNGCVRSFLFEINAYSNGSIEVSAHPALPGNRHSHRDRPSSTRAFYRWIKAVRVDDTIESIHKRRCHHAIESITCVLFLWQKRRGSFEAGCGA